MKRKIGITLLFLFVANFLFAQEITEKDLIGSS